MKERCKYVKASLQFAVGSRQRILSLVYCLLLILLIVGCGEMGAEKQEPETKDSAAEKIIYCCPMHPEVQQDHPGKCPKPECKGMELVPKMSKGMINVLKPVNTSVLTSVKTTKPVFQKMPMDVEANGYIDYDDRTKNNISSLVSGRIEKLYVKYNYQPIHAGEKVFEIYSPELVTAQENLIYVLNNDADETTLIESAKQKLRLLGFSDDLLNELVKTKKVMRTVPVYSKYEGHVHQMEEMKSSPTMNQMGASQVSNYASDKELAIKEGQYVMMGETVFNVISQESIAVILQIKAEDLGKVTKGQMAEVIIDGGMTMNSKIDFIEPILKKGTKTIIAKVYFNNAKLNHKIGSLLKSKIKGKEFEALWVPLSAIVDLGKEKVVWVKREGNFIAKKVETGVSSDNMIEISDGLTESDEIAMEAHYLTDSEEFIKTNENEY